MLSVSSLVFPQYLINNHSEKGYFIHGGVLIHELITQCLKVTVWKIKEYSNISLLHAKIFLETEEK